MCILSTNEINVVKYENCSWDFKSNLLKEISFFYATKDSGTSETN